MKKLTLPKKFDELSPEQQIKFLERETEKLIKRLPSLKKILSSYDDRSNELYNIEGGSIRLLTKSYISDISGGTKASSLQSYVQSLTKYSRVSLKELRLEASELRIESFMESISKSGASQYEINYVKLLLDKMSPELKEKFTKSKLFWDYGIDNSESVRNFMDLYDVTPATANLENFLEQNGITTGRLYYEEGITQKHQGKIKTRGRKRKKK